MKIQSTVYSLTSWNKKLVASLRTFSEETVGSVPLVHWIAEQSIPALCLLHTGQAAKMASVSGSWRWQRAWREMEQNLELFAPWLCRNTASIK